MSKKKFTDGLESLFTIDNEKDVSGKGTAFLRNPSGKEEAKTAVKKRSSSRKTFTTDLDSLLEEALQESFDEQMARRESEKATDRSKYQKQARRPMTGLDMLIRRTVEKGTIEEDRKTGTKRLTVALNKNKILKLKKIARLKKAYLKDILGELVGEYIERYEKERGDI
ncbi:MAG TPA: hypothetical protein ENJ95_08090 [Bacteroidetes bacterium]|nr:hypothetical protein [Bacteroidota bacterium]